MRLLLVSAACALARGGSLSCGSSLCFASGFGSGGVLQRAPARAAIYGSSPLPCSTLNLWLNASDGSSSRIFHGSTAADLTWKILLDPMAMGGNYSLDISCAETSQRSVISDLTVGEVIVCAGQSNEWLPLWFTEERNLTTAAVIDGKYSNLRLWRGGLRQTTTRGNFVLPAGPAPGSDPSDALTNQWRRPADLVPPNFIRDGEPWLWEFPSTCFYTYQHLTDLLGDAAPTFGLLSVPVGGTMLEEWASPAAQAQCKNVTCMCATQGCDPYQPLNANCTKNSDLYYGSIQPFLNMTIGGFNWLQGENNLEYDAGNSADGTGYSCLIAATVADWRATWSSVPGTTDPLVPFVFATIADGSDEGMGINMARMRLAQTASYGIVPNAALPMTAQALAHDKGDPWDADTCANRGCCVDPYIPLGPTCVGDHRGFWSVNATPWFQGCIHPRPKGILGRQLARAAQALSYGGGAALQLSGPALAGCTVSGATLTLRFNATLLAGAAVTWSANASRNLENTALYALAAPAALPADYGAGHHGSPGSYKGPYANGNEWGVEGWVALDAVSGPGAAELSVDLTPLGGAAPTAIRYASGAGGWGSGSSNRMCCGPSINVAVEPCAPNSCPLQAGGLPGVPFTAAIDATGHCTCAPPMSCNA